MLHIKKSSAYGDRLRTKKNSPRLRLPDHNKQLPSNLHEWRAPESMERELQIWADLDKVFCDAGFALWECAFGSLFRCPDGKYPSSSGFGYARTDDLDQFGTLRWLLRFDFPVCLFFCLFYRCLTFHKKNGLARPARSRDGLFVVIRVIVIGNEGHDHLKILRTIATGEKSLLSNNHALPMFAEFQFEDIIFGIFPQVGGGISYAYDCWAKNSVGDIVEMLMQMLEVSLPYTSCPSLKVKIL